MQLVTTKMNFTTFNLISIFLCYFVPVMLLHESEVVTARNLGGAQEKISSVLFFGDSTADSGNNNYIATMARSNFLPYGKDFVNHMATGRFSNGRLANDYIASYVGVKEFVPPYLDPTLGIEELMTGVSFASGGSGLDPFTPKISNVISMPEQLNYLKEYRAKLEVAIGKDKTKEHINNALFFISAGTNDFTVNYFTVPIRRKTYTIQTYMNYLIQEHRQFLQGLLDEGARRIGVVGLPPMGCLPVVISMYSDHPILKRDCINNFSSIARDYNQVLQKELNAMQLASPGSRITYFDAYGPLEAMTLGHQYGFEEVNHGCCGSGLVEFSLMCNPKSVVCANATKYVFFDSVHPSERAYQLLVQTLHPVIDHLVGK